MLQETRRIWTANTSRVQYLNRLIVSTAKPVLIVWLLTVLIITLYPFSFSISGETDFWPALFSTNAAGLKELAANVVLFWPFGFFSAALLRRRRWRWYWLILVVSGFSTILSFTFETLQSLMPERNPSVLDVMANGAGGLLGTSCFAACESALQGRLLSRIKDIVFWTLTGYGVGLFVFSFIFSWNSEWWGLENWEDEFPLVLGNENSGNRPWLGTIGSFFMTDTLLSNENIDPGRCVTRPSLEREEPLIAGYQVDESGILLRGRNNLPPLIWQNSGSVNDSEVLNFNDRQWLRTPVPVSDVTSRLREANQFTLCIEFNVADLAQDGPARILSISGDANRRNLTLGQSGTHLVLRVRTPLTGVNGTRIEFYAPVLQTTESNRLLINYEPDGVRLWVNGEEDQHFIIPFTPLNTFIWYLMSITNRRQVEISQDTRTWELPFYNALLFIPLGFLIRLVRTRFSLSVTFLFGSIIALPLFQQLLFSLGSGTKFQMGNGILSISATMVGVLLAWSLYLIVSSYRRSITQYHA